MINVFDTSKYYNIMTLLDIVQGTQGQTREVVKKKSFSGNKRVLVKRKVIKHGPKNAIENAQDEEITPNTSDPSSGPHGEERAAAR